MLLVQYPILASALFYLDPGTGSFLIQLLLAVFLGAGVAVKIYWSKIKGLFLKKEAQPVPVSERKDDEE